MDRACSVTAEVGLVVMAIGVLCHVIWAVSGSDTAGLLYLTLFPVGAAMAAVGIAGVLIGMRRSGRADDTGQEDVS